MPKGYKTVVSYMYFDAEWGQQWYHATWSPTLTCPIDGRHKQWLEKEIKKRTKKQHVSGITVTKIECDGKVTYNEPVHSWV